MVIPNKTRIQNFSLLPLIKEVLLFKSKTESTEIVNTGADWAYVVQLTDWYHGQLSDGDKQCRVRNIRVNKQNRNNRNYIVFELEEIIYEFICESKETSQVF